MNQVAIEDHLKYEIVQNECCKNFRARFCDSFEMFNALKKRNKRS